MAKSQKYTYQVNQGDSDWSVEISRRVTSRVTVISKEQAGFSTEAEAKEWGESEVKAFLDKSNVGEQEKRRVKKEVDEKKSANKYKGKDVT